MEIRRVQPYSPCNKFQDDMGLKQYPITDFSFSERKFFFFLKVLNFFERIPGQAGNDHHQKITLGRMDLSHGNRILLRRRCRRYHRRRHRLPHQPQDRAKGMRNPRSDRRASEGIINQQRGTLAEPAISRLTEMSSALNARIIVLRVRF